MSEITIRTWRTKQRLPHAAPVFKEPCLTLQLRREIRNRRPLPRECLLTGKPPVQTQLMPTTPTKLTTTPMLRLVHSNNRVALSQQLNHIGRLMIKLSRLLWTQSIKVVIRTSGIAQAPVLTTLSMVVQTFQSLLNSAITWRVQQMINPALRQLLIVLPISLTVSVQVRKLPTIKPLLMQSRQLLQQMEIQIRYLVLIIQCLISRLRASFRPTSSQTADKLTSSIGLSTGWVVTDYNWKPAISVDTLARLPTP